MRKKLLSVCFLLAAFGLALGAQNVVVDSLEVDKGLTTTPAELLKGRVSGVNVSLTDGSPSGAVMTYIRGLNSVRDDSQPLWIVDGVMLNNSTNLNIDAFWNDPGKVTSMPLNELAFINPYDIESIEVLKNTSATAVYGAKGANGVIIVRTKMPESGALKVNWRSNVGFTSPMDASEASTALAHDHFVSMSSTEKSTSYYLSGYYRDIDGVVNGAANNYGGIRLGMEANALDVFQFGIRSSITVGNQASRRMDDDVDYALDYRLLNSVFLNVNFTKDFYIHGDIGVDYQNKTRYFWLGNGTEYGAANNGANAILASSIFAYNANVALGYKHNWSNSAVDVKAGWEATGNWDRLNNMNGTDFFSHELREKSLNIMSSKPVTHKFTDNYAHKAFFLAPSFSFGDYATINLTARMDNTPYFDDGSQSVGAYDKFLNMAFGKKTFLIYPAAEGSFDFIKAFGWDNDILTSVKANAGWGRSGRERMVPYRLYGMFSSGDYHLVENDIQDFYHGLGRAVSDEFHAGLEFGIADKVTLGVTYYDKTTYDRLSMFSYGEPKSEDSSFWVRADRQDIQCEEFKIRNKGVEFDLDAVIMDKENIKWSVDACLALNTLNLFSSDMHVTPAARNAFATEYHTPVNNPLPKAVGGISSSVVCGNFLFEALADWQSGKDILYKGKVENGSFFRLSKLSAEYDFPVPSINWIESVGVNLSVANIFTISDYSGWNPDVNSCILNAYSLSSDLGLYPMVRSFLLGVNVKF